MHTIRANSETQPEKSNSGVIVNRKIHYKDYEGGKDPPHNPQKRLKLEKYKSKDSKTTEEEKTFLSEALPPYNPEL